MLKTSPICPFESPSSADIAGAVAAMQTRSRYVTIVSANISAKAL